MPTGDAIDQIMGQKADCLTKPVNDAIQGFEYFIPESHRTKLLPDLLYGIHFWSVGWYAQQGNVLRNLEGFRPVPACAIANQQNVIVGVSL